jgi:hypothetical protein
VQTDLGLAFQQNNNKQLIEGVRTGLFQRGGAGFIDNSRLFHTEGMLDLSRWTGKWIDIQVGGNHRMYSLATQGTVFNQDPDGEVNILELKFRNTVHSYNYKVNYSKIS